MKLSEFLKLYLLMYSGLEDPQEFLVDIEKIRVSLGCASIKMVELISFQLKGKANAWWLTWKVGRPLESPPATWEEFKEAFMNRFLS